MSFTRVQGTGTASSGLVTSQSFAFGSNVTSGNFVVVNVAAFYVLGASTLSVADSQGNTYSADVSSTLSVPLGGNIVSGIFRAQVTSTGALTVTVSSFGSGYLTFGIEEYHSPTGSIFLDTTATGNTGLSSTGTTTPQTSAMTLRATDLVVAGFSPAISGLTFTAGSGFTLGFTNPPMAGSYLATEYQLATTSPVTPSCTLSLASPWNAVAAAYSSASFTVTATGAIVAHADTFAGVAIGGPSNMGYAAITVARDTFLGLSPGTVPTVTAGAITAGLDAFHGYSTSPPSMGTGAIVANKDSFAGLGVGLPGGTVLVVAAISGNADRFTATAFAYLPNPSATALVRGKHDTFAGNASPVVYASAAL